MKKIISVVASCFILAVMITVMLPKAEAAVAKQNAMMKQSNGTYVVNTTSLSRNVRGFGGTTPLKIYIKKNKIVKIEALPNHESPQYFYNVKQYLLGKWDGMKVAKAASSNVDGVTGATFSSKAVKENVKLGLAYYQKNKK
jgi:electron transport complex protein RnfG